MSEVSGKMTSKDVKKLSKALRTGTIGPTTVYYAGVTAPIISAGVGVFTRQVLHNADFISGYWLWFLSTLIAAFAGISWYLIFIRWAYRNTYGRGEEADSETHIKLTETGIVVTRAHITSTIEWAGIKEIRRKSGFAAVLSDNNHSVLIPDRWFGKDKAGKTAFYETLAQHIKT